MTLSRCSALFALFFIASAQDRPPDTVIRINVNLVQVDAVVTDAKGHPITDLRAADFVVLQDGKPQNISNFSYVNVNEGRVLNAVAKPEPKIAKGVPPPPPIPLKADKIRRTVALVVDDLGLSWESIAHVRQSLKKWVENEMQPGDFVAVIRTGAGMGALQQFTADKRMLLAAIERVKYNSFGRAGISTFAPLGSNDTEIDTTAFDEEREQILSVGTMGAIQYVVQGLREMPGRKSVILFSESMRFMFSSGLSDRVNDATRRLVDLANRASVVIYTIDPRGVVPTNITAADNASGLTPQQVSQVSQQRSQYLYDTQQGMDTLAKETGGLFMHTTNDIDGALRKVVEDGEGYYLIGYHPDAATFEDKNGRPKFHTVSVRVKRSGLQVRSRTGFLGTSDKNLLPVAHTREAQIRQALNSPFSTGSLHLRLTTLYTQTPSAGSVINSLVYFDPRELQFADEPDDWHKAVIDLVAITFGDTGQSIDSTSKTWTLRVRGATFAEIQKNGMLYSIHVAVKKAGAYQMRVVLRDAGTEQVGSATQFIEVPDIGKGRLTLSGIVLRADNSKTATDTEGHIEAEDPNGTAAVRIFKPGTPIAYGYQILNAQAGPDSKPQLEVQTRLFRDGQQVYEGKPAPMPAGAQGDPKWMVGGGRMQLGSNISAGDYVLQVIVTDKLAKEKNHVATQSMDFEVR